MQLVQHRCDVAGLPLPNEIHLVLDNHLPPAHLVTSALGFLFAGDRVLLTHLVSRGWEIPGGHLEPGETPEDALRREALEETGAVIRDLQVVGYEKITIHGAKPARYPYPYPVSYQVFYCGRVAELRPYEATAEVSGRGLFAPGSIPQLDRITRDRQLYEAAVTKAAQPSQMSLTTLDQSDD